MALVVLFAFAQMAMAYTVTTVDGYGPYQTGIGGEFSFKPADGLGWVLNLYNGFAKNQDTNQNSFQTFCLENSTPPEYVYPNTTYSVVINTNAIKGGVGPQGDPISIGTAYLYYNFVKGTLTDPSATYDYSNPGRSGVTGSSADLLQRAIWYLEGEANGYGPGNPFYDLVAGKFALPGADSNGAYGVKALNLYVQGFPGDLNYLRQDMLVVVPIPAAAWLLASGLIGLVIIRRRMKK